MKTTTTRKRARQIIMTVTYGEGRQERGGMEPYRMHKAMYVGKEGWII